MTKKTLEDYSADILQLTVELSTIPDYHPGYEKLTRQLSNRLGSWQSKLDIIIRVASNEQLPWGDEELGYVQVWSYQIRPDKIRHSKGQDIPAAHMVVRQPSHYPAEDKTVDTVMRFIIWNCVHFLLYRGILSSFKRAFIEIIHQTTSKP
jgi:hypothetical protein